VVFPELLKLAVVASACPLCRESVPVALLEAMALSALVEVVLFRISAAVPVNVIVAALVVMEFPSSIVPVTLQVPPVSVPTARLLNGPPTVLMMSVLPLFTVSVPLLVKPTVLRGRISAPLP